MRFEVPSAKDNACLCFSDYQMCVRFTPAVYKFLLGKECTLTDLKAEDPTLYEYDNAIQLDLAPFSTLKTALVLFILVPGIYEVVLNLLCITLW